MKKWELSFDAAYVYETFSSLCVLLLILIESVYSYDGIIWALLKLIKCFACEDHQMEMQIRRGTRRTKKKHIFKILNLFVISDS